MKVNSLVTFSVSFHSVVLYLLLLQFLLLFIYIYIIHLLQLICHPVAVVILHVNKI